jgi:hypothetical protein
MADSNGNGAFVFGLIVGAIGGTIGTLLYTPKSGDALRDEISAKLGQSTAPVGPAVGEGKERAASLIDRAAEKAQDLSGKIAAMDLPFQGDDGVHIDPAPTPPSPVSSTPDVEAEPRTNPESRPTV